MNGARSKSAPLTGIRVIECGNFIAAPMAGMVLADLGAEIIKVERTVTGDPFRGSDSHRYSSHFTAFNRSKKSIAVDIASPKGRSIVQDLARRCDVLIENFRPGVADKLGIGAQTLREMNPRLIYCSISGFGHTGPYRDRPSYDTVAQSLGGLLSLYLDRSAPEIRGPAVADQVTGLYAALSIQGALYRREVTGEGAVLEVPMIQSMTAFCNEAFAAYFRRGEVQTPTARAAGSQSFAFTCADQKLISLHLSSPEKFWTELIAVVGRPDLANAVDFADYGKRVKNYKALSGELAREFAKRPRSEWMRLLQDADVPHAPIYTIDEVAEDPQVHHLGAFQKFHHEVEGDLVAAVSPFRFDGETVPAFAPPLLGEHSDETLRWLGRSEAEIANLRSEKII